MQLKLLNFVLIVSSLIGYLAWGGNQHMYLFQAEAEIISKLFTDPLSVLHPFTIFPMLGQLLLLVTLFQKKPSKVLTIISLIGLGILLALMCFIGIISSNLKIIISTLPFLVTATITMIYLIRTRKKI
ncbi:MAG: hypothetical protein KA198_02475 [Chitinophagaceae bacterium]|nr:hypothetical protein [Chitinophagaceae bacterium]